MKAVTLVLLLLPLPALAQQSCEDMLNRRLGDSSELRAVVVTMNYNSTVTYNDLTLQKVSILHEPYPYRLIGESNQFFSDRLSPPPSASPFDPRQVDKLELVISVSAASFQVKLRSLTWSWEDSVGMPVCERDLLHGWGQDTYYLIQFSGGNPPAPPRPNPRPKPSN